MSIGLSAKEYLSRYYTSGGICPNWYLSRPREYKYVQEVHVADMAPRR